MIKALLLIFIPVHTWEHIAAFERKTATVLMTYLLPMVILSTAAECFGIVHWGTPRGRVDHLTPFPISEAIVYGVGRILLSVAVVFIMAKLIKSLGETFHGRHSFDQVFKLAAYGMSPLFLLRLLNIFPVISPWATWAVGLILCMAILYHGIPVIMRPDPPHAFGLYFMSSLLMAFVTGLTCFLTVFYLQGRFGKLDELIAAIASHLPFK